MWSRKFWLATLERCLKTVAQTALASFAVGTTSLLSVPWPAVAAVAGLAGVVSVLTSIASSGVADSSSPSLVKE
jgi:hypothetical protein